MNERDLELTLRAIGHDHLRQSAPARLHDRIRHVSETPTRGGFVPRPTWRFQSLVSATKLVVAGVIVALVGGFLASGVLTRPAAVPGAGPTDAGTFSPTGSLAQPRTGHTATLLPDGRILVVGGVNWWDESNIATAEIWDPATETFGPTGAPAEARASHTATLLPDGRVLVVGGFGDPDGKPIASAEIWDPATASFSPAGSLAKSSDSHTATLLPDGRVLVFGGTAFPAEVWDPDTDTFSPADSLALDGPISSATLLPDGRVLVIGGKDRTSAEVWDPVTASFGPTGSLALGRDAHSATALPDGRVLITGGCTPLSWECPSTDAAEVWDPDTNAFGPTGSLAAKRGIHAATALPDGRVLVVGGWGDAMLLASAEIWEPGDG